MVKLLYLAAAFLMLLVAASLVRILLGPRRADRIMGAQLIGTSGVGVLLLLAVAQDDMAVLDVALVLALLAAFAAIAFVKSASRGGAGDPELDAAEDGR